MSFYIQSYLMFNHSTFNILTCPIILHSVTFSIASHSTFRYILHSVTFYIPSSSTFRHILLYIPSLSTFLPFYIPPHSTFWHSIKDHLRSVILWSIFSEPYFFAPYLISRQITGKRGRFLNLKGAWWMSERLMEHIIGHIRLNVVISLVVRQRHYN